MNWFNFRIITKDITPGARVKLNIRNMHRVRSLFSSGMLPRICYANDPKSEKLQSLAKMGWHVDPKVTSNVKFESTNQRNNFDPECLRSDISYHTVSFIYEV